MVIVSFITFGLCLRIIVLLLPFECKIQLVSIRTSTNTYDPSVLGRGMDFFAWVFLGYSMLILSTAITAYTSMDISEEKAGDRELKAKSTQKYSQVGGF